MTHLDREEIVRWWQEGAPSDRHRFVEHLAECDACGALFGELIDARPPDQNRRGIEEIESLKSRGYAAYAPGPTEEPVTTSRYAPSGLGPRQRVASGFSRTIGGLLQTKWIAVAAGCAAAVTLVAVLYPSWRTERAIVEPVDSSVRGAAIQLLSPSGLVKAPFTFEWTSPVAAARYEVEVVDAGRQRIWSTAVERSTSITAPPELVSRLTSTGRYRWSVTALDERGAPLAQSAPQPFWISGTP